MFRTKVLTICTILFFLSGILATASSQNNNATVLSPTPTVTPTASPSASPSVSPSPDVMESPTPAMPNDPTMPMNTPTPSPSRTP